MLNLLILSKLVNQECLFLFLRKGMVVQRADYCLLSVGSLCGMCVEW